MAKKILLTGFEPFDKDIINPSWEAVRTLDGHYQGEYLMVAGQLPTVFGRSLEVLEDVAAREKPQAVICVGQAGGRPDITIERLGINVDDARIPDNDGLQPVDREIVPGGPAAYWSTLPVKAIVKELHAQGVPASVSNSAGTFVCNHVLYGLLHFLSQKNLHIPAGFIHVPYLLQQGTEKPGQPTMSIEVVSRALEIAVMVTVLSLEHE